jgi:ribonuclease-3
LFLGAAGARVADPDSEGVGALARRLGHVFADPGLLARALTHASYANEHPPTLSNESLALLGDAALGLVVAEHLLRVTPDAPVGLLTPQRALLVSGANLARWAASLEIGPLLRVGGSLEGAGGRHLESVLATALEATLGALYLDGGLPAVRRVVGRLALW